MSLGKIEKIIKVASEDSILRISVDTNGFINKYIELGSFLLPNRKINLDTLIKDFFSA